MKRNARKAFNQLKKIGCPVLETEDYGHFIISAENNGTDPHIDAVENILWADAYEGYTLERVNVLDPNEILWAHGINTKIHRILKDNGLMSEWINPGMIGVYDA